MILHAKQVMPSLVVGLCAIFFVGLTAVVQADIVELQDANSQAYFDDTTPQRGMYAWVVDGRSYDSQQWFWYRIGSTGPESSIDTLSAPTVAQTDPSYAAIAYGNASLTVTVTSFLTGYDPGTGQSDINEVIRLKNNTSSAMTLHFFEYNNFILSDPPEDTVNFVNANRVVQTGPHDVLSENYNSGEGVVTGYPTHEAALFSATRDSLNDGAPTNFTNIDSAGPGDVTWAFQWDLSIAAGKTVSISKDKMLNVPEPSSIVLLAVFGACLAIASLRRKIS